MNLEVLLTVVVVVLVMAVVAVTWMVEEGVGLPLKGRELGVGSGEEHQQTADEVCLSVIEDSWQPSFFLQ